MHRQGRRNTPYDYAVLVTLFFVAGASIATAGHAAVAQSTRESISAQIQEEIRESMVPSLERTLYERLGRPTKCVASPALFGPVVDARVYRAAVYCDVEGVTHVSYHTLVEVTRFDDDELYFVTNGFQLGAKTLRK